MTEEELMNKMAVLMGGRAAELLVFDKLSTGATDDLSQMTNIARTMVTRYGMNETLGQVSYDAERSPFLPQTEAYFPPSRSYSEQTAWKIDEAVRELVEQAFVTATDILRTNRQLLDDTAALLLTKETLTSDQLPVVEPFRVAAAHRHSGSSGAT